MGLERLWAGWRLEYIEGAAALSEDAGCVFCRLLDSDEPDETTHVLWRGRYSAALLNAFPYTSGHLMVLPRRHVAELEEVAGDEGSEFWRTVAEAVRALKSAYRPQGINMGANLGRAAGAGVPGHFHVHVVPRWAGDTNFMTSIAEARVMPESLSASYARLRAAWPGL